MSSNWGFLSIVIFPPGLLLWGRLWNVPIFLFSTDRKKAAVIFGACFNAHCAAADLLNPSI